MGINVLRSSGATVTGMLRNDLDWNTHVYQQGCVCVAKVMDMHIGEIVVGKQFFEWQIDVAFIYVFSVLSCDHPYPWQHSHSQTGKQTEGSIIDIHKKFTLRPLAKLSHNLAKYVELGYIIYYSVQKEANMAVSYNRLWKLLVDKKMSKADLRKASGVAPNTMTKLRRDEEVTLTVLGKICKTLNADYGDIMEYIDEEDT